jgi:hypothetical protein
VLVGVDVALVVVEEAVFNGEEVGVEAKINIGDKYMILIYICR